MKTLFTSFIKDESGASAAEYALILAVVGVAIGGTSLLLADTIGTAIGNSAARVDACSDSAAGGTGTDCEAADIDDYTAGTGGGTTGG